MISHSWVYSNAIPYRVIPKMVLTVRFLVASARAWTTELLGLTATWVGDQQTPIVLDEDVLNFLL